MVRDKDSSPGHQNSTLRGNGNTSHQQGKNIHCLVLEPLTQKSHNASLRINGHFKGIKISTLKHIKS